jgi:hypothetical protein
MAGDLERPREGRRGDGLRSLPAGRRAAARTPGATRSAPTLGPARQLLARQQALDTDLDPTRQLERRVEHGVVQRAAPFDWKRAPPWKRASRLPPGQRRSGRGADVSIDARSLPQIARSGTPASWLLRMESGSGDGSGRRAVVAAWPALTTGARHDQQPLPAGSCPPQRADGPCGLTARPTRNATSPRDSARRRRARSDARRRRSSAR